MYGFQANAYISAEVTREGSRVVTIVERWGLVTNHFHYVSQIWKYRSCFFYCYSGVPQPPSGAPMFADLYHFACFSCQSRGVCVCVCVRDGKKLFS